MNSNDDNNAQTPEQKREIIERLYALWLQHPTLRLGELISVSQLHWRRDFDLIEILEWVYQQTKKEQQSEQ
jgi:hypothetical protein